MYFRIDSESAVPPTVLIPECEETVDIALPTTMADEEQDVMRYYNSHPCCFTYTFIFQFVISYCWV